MPQLDKLTYFSQFFWLCLLLFTFYILFINNNNGILGISRILKLRNQLLSHRGNKMEKQEQVLRVFALMSIRLVMALPIFLVMWFGSQGSLPIDPHILGVVKGSFVRQGVLTICRLLGFDMPVLLIIMVANILMGTSLGPAGGGLSMANYMMHGAGESSNSALFTYTSAASTNHGRTVSGDSFHSALEDPLHVDQPSSSKTKKVMLLLKKGVTKLKAVPAKFGACFIAGMANEFGRHAAEEALPPEAAGGD